MTPISDSNAFYGKYISKKEKAVPLSISRDIERWSMEYATQARISRGDIERAHKELDKLGVTRNQINAPHFPLSLSGRIIQIRKQWGVRSTCLQLITGKCTDRIPR